MSAQAVIVLFEDDTATGHKIEKSIRKALGKSGACLRFPLTKDPTSSEEHQVYEERIKKTLKTREFAKSTLIVTDRDLSKHSPFRGLSEAVVSRVGDELGIPVALYARGVSSSVFDHERQWGDGKIVMDFNNGIPELGRQAAIIANGFVMIKNALPQAIRTRSNDTPAKVVAALLEKPDAADKIALYGAGDQQAMIEILHIQGTGAEDARIPRAVGYWLWDSILRFPGLVVEGQAAASYLNINTECFAKPSVQKLFSRAVYKGPFFDTKRPRWWRSELDRIVETAKCGDGREFAQKRMKKHIPGCSCSVDPTLQAGYFCMLTGRPVSLEKSKTVTWFPPGADLSRASIPAFAKRGPWLGEF